MGIYKKDFFIPMFLGLNKLDNLGKFLRKTETVETLYKICREKLRIRILRRNLWFSIITCHDITTLIHSSLFH